MVRSHDRRLSANHFDRLCGRDCAYRKDIQRKSIRDVREKHLWRMATKIRAVRLCEVRNIGVRYRLLPADRINHSVDERNFGDGGTFTRYLQIMMAGQFDHVRLYMNGFVLIAEFGLQTARTGHFARFAFGAHFFKPHIGKITRLVMRKTAAMSGTIRSVRSAISSFKLPDHKHPPLRRVLDFQTCILRAAQALQRASPIGEA